jgi:hypothetical protein
MCTIGRFKINDKRPVRYQSVCITIIEGRRDPLYDASRTTKSVLLLNEAICEDVDEHTQDAREDETQVTLYHGMLFRTRGMFKGYVCNRAVTTYEVRTLAMYVKQI